MWPISDTTFRHDNCILNSLRRPHVLFGNMAETLGLEWWQTIFGFPPPVRNIFSRNLETIRPTRVFHFIVHVWNSSPSFTSPVNRCIPRRHSRLSSYLGGRGEVWIKLTIYTGVPKLCDTYGPLRELFIGHLDVLDIFHFARKQGLNV